LVPKEHKATKVFKAFKDLKAIKDLKVFRVPLAPKVNKALLVLRV
jgi:hypothetical protein